MFCSAEVILSYKATLMQLSVGAISLKYFEKRKKAKLYRQWVERAGLIPDTVPPRTDKSKDVPLGVDSSEAVTPEDGEFLRVHFEPDSGVVTHPEVTGNMLAEINRRQPRLRMLYILLGVTLVILCAGLILLIVLSC